MKASDALRYEVYDEDNVLFRKFNERSEAEKFLQKGWKLVTRTKRKEPKPTIETDGEARW